MKIQENNIFSSKSPIRSTNFPPPKSSYLPQRHTFIQLEKQNSRDSPIKKGYSMLNDHNEQVLSQSSETNDQFVTLHQKIIDTSCSPPPPPKSRPDNQTKKVKPRVSHIDLKKNLSLSSIFLAGSNVNPTAGKFSRYSNAVSIQDGEVSTQLYKSQIHGQGGQLTGRMMSIPAHTLAGPTAPSEAATGINPLNDDLGNPNESFYNSTIQMGKGEAAEVKESIPVQKIISGSQIPMQFQLKFFTGTIGQKHEVGSTQVDLWEDLEKFIPKRKVDPNGDFRFKSQFEVDNILNLTTIDAPKVPNLNLNKEISILENQQNDSQQYYKKLLMEHAGVGTSMDSDVRPNQHEGDQGERAKSKQKSRQVGYLDKNGSSSNPLGDISLYTFQKSGEGKEEQIFLSKYQELASMGITGGINSKNTLKLSPMGTTTKSKFAQVKQSPIMSYKNSVVSNSQLSSRSRIGEKLVQERVRTQSRKQRDRSSKKVNKETKSKSKSSADFGDVIMKKGTIKQREEHASEGAYSNEKKQGKNSVSRESLSRQDFVQKSIDKISIKTKNTKHEEVLYNSFDRRKGSSNDVSNKPNKFRSSNTSGNNSMAKLNLQGSFGKANPLQSSLEKRKLFQIKTASNIKPIASAEYHMARGGTAPHKIPAGEAPATAPFRPLVPGQFSGVYDPPESIRKGTAGVPHRSQLDKQKSFIEMVNGQSQTDRQYSETSIHVRRVPHEGNNEGLISLEIQKMSDIEDNESTCKRNSLTFSQPNHSLGEDQFIKITKQLLESDQKSGNFDINRSLQKKNRAYQQAQHAHDNQGESSAKPYSMTNGHLSMSPPHRALLVKSQMNLMKGDAKVPPQKKLSFTSQFDVLQRIKSNSQNSHSQRVQVPVESSERVLVSESNMAKSQLVTEPGEEVYRKIDEERARKEEFIRQKLALINKIGELIQDQYIQQGNFKTLSPSSKPVQQEAGSPSKKDNFNVAFSKMKNSHKTFQNFANPSIASKKESQTKFSQEKNASFSNMSTLYMNHTAKTGDHWQDEYTKMVDKKIEEQKAADLIPKQVITNLKEFQEAIALANSTNFNKKGNFSYSLLKKNFQQLFQEFKIDKNYLGIEQQDEAVKRASEKMAIEQPKRKNSSSSFKSLGSIISEKPVKNQNQDHYFTKEKMKLLMPIRRRSKKKRTSKKERKISISAVQQDHPNQLPTQNESLQQREVTQPTEAYFDRSKSEAQLPEASLAPNASGASGISSSRQSQNRGADNNGNQVLILKSQLTANEAKQGASSSSLGTGSNKVHLKVLPNQKAGRQNPEPLIPIQNDDSNGTLNRMISEDPNSKKASLKIPQAQQIGETNEGTLQHETLADATPQSNYGGSTAKSFKKAVSSPNHRDSPKGSKHQQKVSAYKNIISSQGESMSSSIRMSSHLLSNQIKIFKPTVVSHQKNLSAHSVDFDKKILESGTNSVTQRVENTSPQPKEYTQPTSAIKIGDENSMSGGRSSTKIKKMADEQVVISSPSGRVFIEKPKEGQESAERKEDMIKFGTIHRESLVSQDSQMRETIKRDSTGLSPDLAGQKKTLRPPMIIEKSMTGDQLIRDISKIPQPSHESDHSEANLDFAAAQQAYRDIGNLPEFPQGIHQERNNNNLALDTTNKTVTQTVQTFKTGGGRPHDSSSATMLKMNSHETNETVQEKPALAIGQLATGMVESLRKSNDEESMYSIINLAAQIPSGAAGVAGKPQFFNHHQHSSRLAKHDSHNRNFHSFQRSDASNPKHDKPTTAFDQSLEFPMLDVLEKQQQIKKVDISLQQHMKMQAHNATIMTLGGGVLQNNKRSMFDSSQSINMKLGVSGSLTNILEQPRSNFSQRKYQKGGSSSKGDQFSSLGPPSQSQIASYKANFGIIPDTIDQRSSQEFKIIKCNNLMPNIIPKKQVKMKKKKSRQGAHPEKKQSPRGQENDKIQLYMETKKEIKETQRLQSIKNFMNSGQQCLKNDGSWRQANFISFQDLIANGGQAPPQKIYSQAYSPTHKGEDADSLQPRGQCQSQLHQEASRTVVIPSVLGSASGSQKYLVNSYARAKNNIKLKSFLGGKQKRDSESKVTLVKKKDGPGMAINIRSHTTMGGRIGSSGLVNKIPNNYYNSSNQELRSMVRTMGDIYYTQGTGANPRIPGGDDLERTGLSTALLMNDNSMVTEKQESIERASETRLPALQSEQSQRKIGHVTQYQQYYTHGNVQNTGRGSTDNQPSFYTNQSAGGLDVTRSTWTNFAGTKIKNQSFINLKNNYSKQTLGKKDDEYMRSSFNNLKTMTKDQIVASSTHKLITSKQSFASKGRKLE